VTAAAVCRTHAPSKFLDAVVILLLTTVARWIDEGHNMHAAIFTRGDKGHDDPAMRAERVAALREVEQRAAAAILGVSQFS
jgi:LmbE family N-acetylglucosaminyl deacetylase